MIVIMKAEATAAEIDSVFQKAQRMGVSPHPIYGADHTVVALVGDLTKVERSVFDAMAGVQKTVRIQEPYKLAGRTSHPHNTVIDVGGVKIGGNEIVVMAGPCSVESREQILEVAHMVKEAGATVLRGGAFKPRTSPYSFQGLGEKGLQYLAEAREQTGLPIITEVMREEAVEMVCEYADILQIGAREHAELRSAASRGKGAEARHAQAWHQRRDQRAADVRRVHSQRRQQPGDAVRARHSHL